MKQIISLMSCLIVLICLNSCDSDKTIGVVGGPSGSSGSTIEGIPSDNQATAPPLFSNDPATIIPNSLFKIANTVNGKDIIEINMTGIIDPSSSQWAKLYGTLSKTQNIWIIVDGVSKGFIVVNNSGGSQSIKTDLVFSVDNSGSMDQEADAIANDIASWCNFLSGSGLDILFGCVGYDGTLTGAIDLTDAMGISDYLNRSGANGTNRTFGFEGPNAASLQTKASTYDPNSLENGLKAIRFANDQFLWRNGANRIFINFTDEPNQPNNNSEYSTDWLPLNWDDGYMGTIHSVLSSSLTGPFSKDNEDPAKFSIYTGGTEKRISDNASDLDLMSLPVTGAMTNSYTFQFIETSSIPNGQHVVEFHFINNNGTTGTIKTFTNISYN